MLVPRPETRESKEAERHSGIDIKFAVAWDPRLGLCIFDK